MSDPEAKGRQPGPLDGFLVAGLEHSVAGPLCTRILADLGADVIKIERAPNGDFARHWDTNVRGECSQFWWLNRRKQSIVLDLKNAQDHSAFEALLEKADAFVCNLSPGASERLGLTPDSMTSRFPQLVVCQISGYGASGPLRDRKAYDMLVQAEAGVMSLTGSPDQPSRVGVSIADVGTGIYAATLVLGGLLGRMRHGQGRYLDVAMQDATLEFAAPMLISYLNAGILYPRLPDRHHAIAPYGVFQCADGTRVLVAIEHDSEWRRFAEAVLKRPELGDDPRFATNVARLADRDAVDSMTAEAVGSLDGPEAIRVFDSLGLAYASLNDMAGVSTHPVVVERQMLDDVDMTDGSPARTLVGMGERLFMPNLNGRERPPGLGEDTEAILEALGLTAGSTADRGSQLGQVDNG
jgi:crotonobetainyl-CoA:carnitine CoA-transferase CaiB-like acyl-CoA transferase